MITSVHNPKIQSIRKLQTQVKARQAEQSFVVEGVRLAEEALQSGWEAQQVLFTAQLDERGQAVSEGFATRGVPAEEVTEMVMNAVSDTQTPQGLLVVLALRPLPIPQSTDFMLILDGIRDPGNLGTILRTAAAAGAQAVVMTPGSTDAFAPKVMRAGMGAHFQLPIHQLGWDGIRRILKGLPISLRIYLADSAVGILADEKVHIPMPGGSESLNASIAASILLFEVVRQRGA
jgi:TrmH family RNA methyltransferase